MNKSKGFTIIELIVVIAIIAVLAAIVMVNVTQYINKSRNVAIQGNMANLLINSAVYFDNHSSGFGNNFTADTTGCAVTGPIYIAIKNAYGSSPDLTCVGDFSSPAWCAYATMLSGGTYATWCVDSTGYKGAKGGAKCTGVIYTCQ
jgi:prepilin-type N-terminal cleavage/methylation domain-containing protein